MTITIDLPSDVETALEKKASASGMRIEAYIEDLARKKALQPTLDEILKPIHQNFEESGMSEKELNELIDDLREKVWVEKQAE